MAQSIEIRPSTVPAAPRRQFVDGLGARVDALREALSGLEAEPFSVVRRTTLRNRLEAMADAARTLNLDAVASAFTSAESTLAGATDGLSARDLRTVGETLELVPSLVPDDLSWDEQDGTGPLAELAPATVVCLGLLATQAQLSRTFEAAPQLSLQFTVELEDALTLVRKYEPDLVLLDARRIDVEAAMSKLGELAPCVLFEVPGDRTLEAQPGGALLAVHAGEPYADVLYRSLQLVNETTSANAEPSERSVIELVSVVTDELQSALLDDIQRGDPSQSLPLGTDSEVRSALWSTIARLRALIVERSANSIEYRNQGPEGAYVVDSRQGVRTLRGAADPDNLKGRTVLVADDDPAIIWFLASVLRSAGANVLEASDGIKAWETALREDIDLVVSDVLMPELDGFALCRNLKRDVVLSDVPVVLLSWKEDLLQRVRELGVGADGYLAKEAEAPEIIDRCAEALKARSRVEKRLSSEQVIYGRLDGLTPRLVMALACEAIGTGKVVFHEAAFTYEVYLGEGRLLAAARVSREGQRESGDKVLPGLLGMRAGRFVVERGGSELVQAELSGPLDAALAPHIRRARAAVAQVQGGAMQRIAQLELNPETVAPYKRTSPSVVAQLVEKLEAGVSPASLLRSVSAGLLESVLLDLATRGAISHAFDAEDNDLLERLEDAPMPLFDVDVRTPQAGECLTVAKGAPTVHARSSDQDAARAASFTESLQEQIAESKRPPRVIPLPDDLRAGPADGRDRPIESGSAFAAVEKLMPTNGPEEGDFDMASVVFDKLSASPEAPGLLTPAPADAGRKPQGERNLGEPAGPELEAASGGAEGPPTAELPSSGPPPAELPSWPEAPSTIAQTDESSESPSPGPSTRGWARMLRRRARQLGDLLTQEPESEEPPEVGTLVGDVSPPRAPSSERAPSPERPGVRPPPPVTGSDDLELEELLEEVPAQSATPGQVAASSTESTPEPSALRRSSRVRRVLGPIGIVLLAAGGAFGAISLFTNLSNNNGTSSGEAASTNLDNAKATESSVVSVATATSTGTTDLLPPGMRAAAKETSPSMISADLELPPNVKLAPGKGLIEVDSGGSHKIYVDGVFVGRGPVRRVPVKSGTHRVELRHDGQSQTVDAGVVAGRRTRLSPARVGSVASP